LKPKIFAKSENDIALRHLPKNKKTSDAAKLYSAAIEVISAFRSDVHVLESSSDISSNEIELRDFLLHFLHLLYDFILLLNSMSECREQSSPVCDMPDHFP
jgi:hypothetical protein